MPKFYAILNERLCDNYRNCPAKRVCEKINAQRNLPSAIRYKESEKKILIDKENCSGCASCSVECGLIRIVNRCQEEYVRNGEFASDPRNKMNFSLERFGCDIINEKYALKDLSEVTAYIEMTKIDKINILEFVLLDNVICPFEAIEVDFIINQFPQLYEYKKYVISSDDIEICKAIQISYSIDHFPAILLISDGKILGTPLTTYYRAKESESERELLKNKLQSEFSKRLKQQ